MTAPDRKPAADNNPPDDGGPLKGAFGALAVMELGFFVLVWIGFGVFAFCQIHAWGIEYDRKVAAVARGEVHPETLHVLRVDQPAKGSDGDWQIVLGEGDKIVDSRQVNSPDGVHVGGEVVAYRFGERYLIPQFDRGGHHWGKWIFLAFGLLPLPVIAAVWYFKRQRS